MSNEVLQRGPITITRFIGGEGSPAGRRARGVCYQLNEERTHVQLTEDEAVEFARWVLKHYEPRGDPERNP